MYVMWVCCVCADCRCSITMQTIGAYAEWLQNFPEALGQAMTLLMGALTNVDFARHAALALVEICTDCGGLLVGCDAVYRTPHLDLICIPRILSIVLSPPPLASLTMSTLQPCMGLLEASRGPP